MTDFDIISALGIGVTTMYVTTVVFGETKPKINEDGEEEYTLAGYLLLAGAYIIKLPIKLFVDTLELFLVKETEVVKYQVVEDVDEDTEDNEFELFV